MVLGVGILVPAILMVGALPAAAQATCVFDEPSGTVTIAMAANLPATVVRSTDAIVLDGVACGTATVTNTELISVTGPGGGPEEVFTIDLSGGPFAPGLTTESDADAEIEFGVSLGEASTLRIAGGAVDEAFTAGTEGVNLNAAEGTGDADVTITGAPTLEILGGEGADALSVNGGDGTGEPVAEVLIDGEAGDDTLAGRIGGSTLTGGDGVDTLDYSTAGAIRANLATGVVQPAVGVVDFVHTAENVIGSGDNDVLVGDGEDNSLLGGQGDDILDGGKGDDELNGGPGRDTASYRSSNTAVVVSLKSGTAEGYGADALSDIENVEGSRRGDELTGDGTPNTLTGGAGPDVIVARGKGDILVGGKGADDLSGGKGRDVLDGGPGRDVLDGGKSRDTCIPGKDPDAWTRCETVKL